MIYSVQLICDMIQYNGFLARGKGLLGNISIIVKRLELWLLFLYYSVSDHPRRWWIMWGIMWWCQIVRRLNKDLLMLDWGVYMDWNSMLVIGSVNLFWLDGDYLMLRVFIMVISSKLMLRHGYLYWRVNCSFFSLNLWFLLILCHSDWGHDCIFLFNLWRFTFVILGWKLAA